MTYANGSSAARSLSIKGESGDAQEIEFATTANWTTYVAKEVDIKLPAGASTITFATVGGNDGPNLDQLELTAVNVTPPDSGITRIANEIAGVSMNATATRIRLFSMTGKLLRESADINTVGLPRGIYILQTVAPGHSIQKIIRVK